MSHAITWKSKGGFFPGWGLLRELAAGIQASASQRRNPTDGARCGSSQQRLEGLLRVVGGNLQSSMLFRAQPRRLCRHQGGSISRHRLYPLYLPGPGIQVDPCSFLIHGWPSQEMSRVGAARQALIRVRGATFGGGWWVGGMVGWWGGQPVPIRSPMFWRGRAEGGGGIWRGNHVHHDTFGSNPPGGPPSPLEGSWKAPGKSARAVRITGCHVQAPAEIACLPAYLPALPSCRAANLGLASLPLPPGSPAIQPELSQNFGGGFFFAQR